MIDDRTRREKLQRALDLLTGMVLHIVDGYELDRDDKYAIIQAYAILRELKDDQTAE